MEIEIEKDRERELERDMRMMVRKVVVDTRTRVIRLQRDQRRLCVGALRKLHKSAVLALRHFDAQQRSERCKQRVHKVGAQVRLETADKDGRVCV